jgi:hypothetical protein
MTGFNSEVNHAATFQGLMAHYDVRSQAARDAGDLKAIMAEAKALGLVGDTETWSTCKEHPGQGSTERQAVGGPSRRVAKCRLVIQERGCSIVFESGNLASASSLS